MKVAIVGAGVAGLRTAMLLSELGVEPEIFEARDRVGGRLRSVTVGVGFYEAGAEWIDSDHSRVLSLLASLGLNAEEHRLQRAYFFNGELSHWLWPEAIAANKRLKSAGAITGRSLSDLLDSVTSDVRTRKYLEAVALSDEGTDSDRVDLAEWLRFSQQYEERSADNDEMSAFRIAGGASTMCERMAKGLEIVCGDELVAVESECSLRFASGRREGFDACVLTLPPPCLERIEGLPHPTHGYCMSETCKIVLEYSAPDWGACGSVLSDLPVQQVWSGGRGEAHVLTCYVNGRGWESLVQEGDPIQAARRCLEESFGIRPELFVRGRVHDWSADTFAGGGFPYLPVGREKPDVPQCGPVKYAGDWTAEWMGFIEGALESAERVVEEIKNEHGLS